MDPLKNGPEELYIYEGIIQRGTNHDTKIYFPSVPDILRKTCDFAWCARSIEKKFWICKSCGDDKWWLGSTKRTVINGFSPPSSQSHITAATSTLKKSLRDLASACNWSSKTFVKLLLVILGVTSLVWRSSSNNLHHRDFYHTMDWKMYKNVWRSF